MKKLVRTPIGLRESDDLESREKIPKMRKNTLFEF